MAVSFCFITGGPPEATPLRGPNSCVGDTRVCVGEKAVRNSNELEALIVSFPPADRPIFLGKATGSEGMKFSELLCLIPTLVISLSSGIGGEVLNSPTLLKPTSFILASSFACFCRLLSSFFFELASLSLLALSARSSSTAGLFSASHGTPWTVFRPNLFVSVHDDFFFLSGAMFITSFILSFVVGSTAGFGVLLVP